MSSLSDLSSSSSDDEPRRQRIVRTRFNPFDSLTDQQFKDRYRVTKPVVQMLNNLIGAQIMPVTVRRNSMSALEQILLAIHFYASGGFQITVADNIRVHKTTACRIIKKVSEAIAHLRPQFIRMPRNSEEINATKAGFYYISQFPNVVGALDCTHIKIQSPDRHNAEMYRNRKGYFSLNVQAICNANLKIMDVICRWPGSVHDTTIFNDSHVCADFESGQYGNSYLLGDGGYPCRPFLLTPFLQPATPSEEAYNRAQISTRNTVERCFGVLKRRFPCLAMGLRVKLETAMNIIVACCVLHNIALANNDVIDLDVNDNSDEQSPSDPPQATVRENVSVRTSLLRTHFNC